MTLADILAALQGQPTGAAQPVRTTPDGGLDLRAILAGAQLDQQRSPYERTMRPGETRSAGDVQDMLAEVILAAGSGVLPSVGPRSFAQRGNPAARPRIDPSEAPHTLEGGGGRSNRGGLWVDDALAAEARYYPGGQFLPMTTPAKATAGARRVGTKAAQSLPVGTNVAEIKLEPSSVGSGFWVRYKLVGGNKEQYLSKTPFQSREEAVESIRSFKQKRDDMYSEKGFQPHPTDIVGVDE